MNDPIATGDEELVGLEDKRDAIRVHNRRHGTAPADAVYVGRPTKWGNPFVIGKDGDRAEVIRWYEQWIANENMDLSELRGKDLVCWCAPEPCHADVLLRLANQPPATSR